MNIMFAHLEYLLTIAITLLGIIDFNILLLLFILSATAWNCCWSQTLLSQLEIHSAGVSHEDANQKFLRSLPSSWSQVALIMRTKPGLDTLSFDDLYNNLRVFEHDVKGTTASSSKTQNVAFVSTENTSSTNDVNNSYSVSSPSVSKSKKKGSSSYTDECIHSLKINQVTMISIRIKKFHKRTGRKLQFETKDLVGFDKTKVKCFNCHKMGHFARDCRAKGNQDSRIRDAGYNGNKTKDNGRRPTYHDDSKDLVIIDGKDIDWSGHVKEDAQNYAMMAYSSNNSGSDNESVFMNKASDLEHTPVNDRFAGGIHAVPPPMTGNYMPSGPDVEIDYSKFTYGPKQTLADELDSKPSEYASCESDSSVETSTSMPEPVKNASKVVCEPKVWTDAPIIKEYESDNDDDSVSNVQEDKEKPSFAFIDSVKHDDPYRTLKDNKIVDIGCSRKMTGNKSHLAHYQEFKGGSVAFGDSNGRIIVKNLVFHSKTKHIEIRHHFIRDANEKKLIQVLKIYTDDNVVDLLTKACDVSIKELASPKQTTLGKDISNPLMAGREDLESLWKLVKESVWRDQKDRYGLAKRYPLTHFTLEQRLNNVRLEVKEESEMSLELLRLVRTQLNEGGGLLGIMDFNILLLLFILSAAAWNYCVSQSLETASQTLVAASGYTKDDVREIKSASKLNQKGKPKNIRQGDASRILRDV
nr:hypothetical protein [Tanacetum cinerariifolium]